MAKLNKLMTTNIQKSEFCPYGISKALYELGYDYASIGSYTDADKFNLTKGGLMYRVIAFPPDNPDFCLAPLRQQAFRWLMEKHRYIHSIEDIGVAAGDSEWGHRFRFSYWRLLDIYNALYIDDSTLGYLTYEDAQDRCLEEIIKKIRKNKK